MKIIRPIKYDIVVFILQTLGKKKEIKNGDDLDFSHAHSIADPCVLYRGLKPPQGYKKLL
jgi:hypothetical protein